MSRTFRINRDYTKTARDGYPWRGCGEKSCPYCAHNRQNVKLRVKETMKDLEGSVITI